jgi:hypothetical protein
VGEPILDGRQSAEMTLAVLMRPLAVGWDRRETALGCMRSAANGDTAGGADRAVC